MALRKPKQEREAAKRAREEARQAEVARKQADALAREQPMWDALEEAVAAHGRGDIRAEEEAIQRGARLADSLAGLISSRAADAFNARLEELHAQGQLRQCELLGYVGQMFFFTDRVLAADRSVYLMDEHVQASVETAGSISVTTHPTLTRMAVGSLLPGSALIPGFAWQKKHVHDNRQLYFTVEHPEWAAVIQLNPDAELAARQVAVGINQAATRIARERRVSVDSQAGAADPLDQLTKLGELRDSGVLTEDEFEAEKSKILASMP